MKIIWKKNTAAYANGENAFCGQIKIGSISWNSITPSPSYKAYFLKDGFLSDVGAETEDECKVLVEKAFEKYISLLGFTKQINMHYELVDALKLSLANLKTGANSTRDMIEQLIKQAEQK